MRIFDNLLYKVVSLLIACVLCAAAQGVTDVERGALKQLLRKGQEDRFRRKPLERCRAFAIRTLRPLQLARAHDRSAHDLGRAGALAARLLGGQLLDAAPHIPIRDLPTLTAHHDGLEADRARASGCDGIVAIGGEVLLSRPVDDGFALVKVPNARGVRVLANNQLSGRTGRRGSLFVPDLRSYLSSPIGIVAAVVFAKRSIVLKTFSSEMPICLATISLMRKLA